jgi:hypothetical protein
MGVLCKRRPKKEKKEEQKHRKNTFAHFGFYSYLLLQDMRASMGRTCQVYGVLIIREN